jgi:hypothetical protein
MFKYTVVVDKGYSFDIHSDAPIGLEDLIIYEGDKHHFSVIHGDKHYLHLLSTYFPLQN